MRILLAGAFYPHVGGIERLMELIAFGLTLRGHETQILTRARPPRVEEKRDFPFAVQWQPAWRKVWRAHRWADVVLHFGLGLRLGWPALGGVRTPQVVSHHFPYATELNEKQAREFLKRWLTRFTRNVSVSAALARTMPGRSVVIPNCFDDTVFSHDATVSREKELVFVGRLVSVKGVDLLLDALQHIGKSGTIPTLTIVGDGPERETLQRQAQPLGARVNFLGSLRSSEIAAVLRMHRVLVVPSRWNEPFGIVALEGVACGCFVVGSAGGGLPEAIGPCGLTFPNGDARALAHVIRRALSNEELRRKAQLSAASHLQQHTRAAVVARYEEILQSVVLRCARKRSDLPPNVAATDHHATSALGS